MKKLDIGNFGNFQEVLEINDRYCQNIASLDTNQSVMDILNLQSKRSSIIPKEEKQTETIHYVSSTQGSQLNHRVVQYFKYMKLLRFQLNDAHMDLEAEKKKQLKIREEK